MPKFVTAHFTMEEVACHDSTPYPEEWVQTRLIPLLNAAEWIREQCGFALHVSSAYRTEEYNRKINNGLGGAKNSQHVQGRALDLQPINGSIKRLQAVAREARKQGLITGIGFYQDFVHVDTRPGAPATWYGSRFSVDNQIP